MQALFETPSRESLAGKAARALRSKIEQFRVRIQVAPRRDEDPDEPFAMVGAPLKPRTPLRTLRASARPDVT